MDIYDQIGTISRREQRAIAKLTEPLKLYFGIDRFWRNSHHLDGSYSLIGNYPPTAELFFGEKLYVGHPYFRHPTFFQSGYVLPQLMQSHDFEVTQGKLIRDGGCFHLFMIVRKTENGFVEYGFATSKPLLGFEMTYLNHLASIEKFIDFFEFNAHKIIRKSEEDSIDLPLLIGAKYNENPRLPSKIMTPEKELKFLTSIDSDVEKTKALFTLTKSEKACLKLYLAGLTAKEIGQKLFRSPRTIERHLENGKGKLGLTTRSQCIDFLIPYIDFL